MCGRYASFREAQDLADAFAIDAALVHENARDLPPSWNVAPTQYVRVVVEREPQAGRERAERSLQLARWAKDPSVGNRMINARAESVQDKPSFAEAFAKRRCIVPADGYYEWKKLTGSTKQPYFIAPTDGAAAALGGLYEFWRDRSRADDDPARWLVTTTIITRPAGADLASIHDRMPLALPRSAWDAWLDPGVGADEAVALLDGEPQHMRAVQVSPLVGSVANNSPALVEPIG
jgi:putative SOS response-associated peptidase YedK